jgi:thiol-disulfide isomerase/thioredoxin
MKTLKFTAVWCSSCAKLKDKLKPGITEVDTDTKEGEDLAELYGITSLPTIVELDDNGVETNRSTGTTDILKKYGI